MNKNKQEERTARKKYGKPGVISYGDIRQVTQAISNNTKTLDGGGGMTSKTG